MRDPCRRRSDVRTSCAPRSVATRDRAPPRLLLVGRRPHELSGDVHSPEENHVYIGRRWKRRSPKHARARSTEDGAVNRAGRRRGNSRGPVGVPALDPWEGDVPRQRRLCDQALSSSEHGRTQAPAFTVPQALPPCTQNAFALPRAARHAASVRVVPSKSDGRRTLLTTDPRRLRSGVFETIDGPGQRGRRPWALARGRNRRWTAGASIPWSRRWPGVLPPAAPCCGCWGASAGPR